MVGLGSGERVATWKHLQFALLGREGQLYSYPRVVVGGASLVALPEMQKTQVWSRWGRSPGEGNGGIFPFEYSMGHFSGILEGELDSCVYIIFPRSHIDFKCPSLAQQLILWFEVRKQFCTFFGSTGMPE